MTDWEPNRQAERREETPGTAGKGPTGVSVGSSPIDELVVRRVFEICHHEIDEAVSGSGLPGEFLGALTANESGGRRDAICFEAAVYEHLKAVASGQAPSYGSIAWPQLSNALQGNVAPAAGQVREHFARAESLDEVIRVITAAEDRALREFSSSWGFTQIMGYHVIGGKATVGNLLDPSFHFKFAVELLSDFAQRFRLRLSCDFECLFRCWNTGRPDGKTFDPDYVRKGMRRMNLYRALRSPQAPRLAAGE